MFHFVAYISFEGTVYELDGLKAGPVAIGPSGTDWFSVALAAIHTKLARHRDSAEFNLMAVVHSQLKMLQDERAELLKRIDEDEMVRLQLEMIEVRIVEETDKRKKWKMDNVRRKHNYIPFIIAMLKALADKNQLIPLLNEARAKTNKR